MSDGGNAKHRTILVLTYAFPPAAYVGVHRTLKYCRYLAKHGWLPVVLTSKPARQTFVDEALCRQIPTEVEVHRTWDLDPVRMLSWFSRIRRRSKPAFAPTSQGMLNGAAATHTSRGFLSRLKGAVISLLTQCPDSHVFWLPFALPKGAWILLKRKVDLLYSSSPPHSSHIGVFLLAKASGKPYVLDFRDPWRVRQGTLGARVRDWVVRNAARVICVSQGERDELRAEFPALPDERFTHITNGFDPEDFVADAEPPPSPARLTLVHAGTIYPGIAGEFFSALQQLAAEEPAVAKALHVDLAGEIAAEYADSVRALESAGIVRAHGLVAHAVALRMVQTSDALVILLGGSSFLPSHIPAKVFEYLQVGKPILAIAPEGELATIVGKSGLGTVVPPQSVPAVVAALRGLLADHAAGRLVRIPNRAYIRTFERAALTEKLVRVLDGVLQAVFARR